MFSKVKKLSQNNTEAMQNKRTQEEVSESTPMTSNPSKKQKKSVKKLYMSNEFDPSPHLKNTRMKMAKTNHCMW